jgi:hypothetical protein
MLESREGMIGSKSSTLGKPAIILGCVSAALLPLLILDMAVQLPYMPEEWWRPEGAVPGPPGSFDLRMMVICPGMVGWLGLWGYLFALAWMPLAAYRAWRARRSGASLRSYERILLATIPTLIIVIELIHHLTPLKYGYPLL